jgi:hypothetical protein
MGTLRGANHSTGGKINATKTVRKERFSAADWYRNNIARKLGSVPDFARRKQKSRISGFSLESGMASPGGFEPPYSP